MAQSSHRQLLFRKRSMVQTYTKTYSYLTKQFILHFIFGCENRVDLEITSLRYSEKKIRIILIPRLFAYCSPLKYVLILNLESYSDKWKIKEPKKNYQ